jgi:hypothetical protein
MTQVLRLERFLALTGATNAQVIFERPFYSREV